LPKAPQSVRGSPAQIPAGLVDVERRRCTGPLEQLLIDGLERRGGAGEDRVDRPDCNRAAKELLHQLNDLSTRKTVANRQGCDRRLQLRTEAATRNTRRQLGTHRASAIGAANALQAVLADLDRKRRQLRHLMPRRPTTRLTLLLAEDMAATATRRPVIDDLPHPFALKQRASMPDVAGLCALLAPRPARPAPLAQPRRIMARRQRRVARVTLQPLLELLNALRQRRQLRVLHLQPRRQRQQRLDHRLPPSRVDRLRLRPLHTRSFATPKRVPAD
jgi:hypothetical protein